MRLGHNLRAMTLGGGFELLPPRQGYIVNTNDEYNTATDPGNQPNAAVIFNEWGRFAGNSWYPGGVGATGEALSWSYDTNNDRILSTVNSSNYIGFVSPETLSYYSMTTTLASSNADDDTISIIVAFK